MYLQKVYNNNHRKQQQNLFTKGHADQLTISSHNNPFYWLSHLEIGQYQPIISNYKSSTTKKQQDYFWYLLALHMRKPFDDQFMKTKQQMIKVYGDNSLIKFVEAQITKKQLIQKRYPFKNMKYQFEKLMAKAQFQNYFNIPDVPVFLISTKWLQQFYIESNDPKADIPPICNQHLVNILPYIDTDDKFSHLNYEVKENCCENQDFKIISFSAWNLLKKAYNGLEIKRFTTNQKDISVEVWFQKINIIIAEESCIFLKDLQILVKRTQDFNMIIERIKRILISYNVIGFKNIKKQWQPIRIEGLSVEQSIRIIQNESDFIEDPHFQKADLNVQTDEANLFTRKTVLLFNLSDKSKDKYQGIYSKLKHLTILQLKDRCHSCNKSTDLFECKCKTVHFCSKKCRQDNKEHLKQCAVINRQLIKTQRLIDHFDCRKRVYDDFDGFIKYGQVGLENLGNTCYMNAALQCILRIIKISKYFISNQHLKDININNVLGSEGQLACGYGEFVKTYYTTNRRALQPSTIQRIIAQNPQFRGHNHQDSQQFLNYFLDKLHEDLNRVKFKPYTEDIQSNGRPDEVVSQLSWQNYKLRNQSHISDCLAGQYRSQIRCPECDKVSITFDPFMSVTLQFPKPQKTEDFEGYILNQFGQFFKINTQIPSSMKTQTFINKYFNKNVVITNQINKKIVKQWNTQKTVAKNKKNLGILFLFEKNQDLEFQVTINIAGKQKKQTNYERRIYVEKVLQNQEQKMIKIIHKAIRYPISVSINKTFGTQEEYLNFCNENQIIKISKVNFTGKNKLHIEVELNKQFQFQQTPKFNITKSDYIPKQKIPIKKVGSSTSISQLFQTFKEKQELTEDNAWYCNVCKDHKTADKIMSIYKLPEYLILHLKRFNLRGNRHMVYGQKVRTSVDLNAIENINGTNYELIGVVNHFGTLIHGHYTAYVKKDDWLYYDDGSVRRSSVNGKQAYLLLYQRVE